MELSKLELDAYHQTGHAVMMAACGFTVERVYIQGSEGEGKSLAAELAVAGQQKSSNATRCVRSRSGAIRSRRSLSGWGQPAFALRVEEEVRHIERQGQR